MRLMNRLSKFRMKSDDLINSEGKPKFLHTFKINIIDWFSQVQKVWDLLDYLLIYQGLKRICDSTKGLATAAEKCDKLGHLLDKY